jgi:hypothetical protein
MHVLCTYQWTTVYSTLVSILCFFSLCWLYTSVVLIRWSLKYTLGLEKSSRLTSRHELGLVWLRAACDPRASRSEPSFRARWSSEPSKPSWLVLALELC